MSGYDPTETLIRAARRRMTVDERERFDAAERSNQLRIASRMAMTGELGPRGDDTLVDFAIQISGFADAAIEAFRALGESIGTLIASGIRPMVELWQEWQRDIPTRAMLLTPDQFNRQYARQRARKRRRDRSAP